MDPNSALVYRHVDVFSPRPFSGNSLAVFPNGEHLSAAQMLAITRELLHFESVFIEPTPDPHTVTLRVFDLLEELDFAGHPILGAACVLHERQGGAGMERWSCALRAKTVAVVTERDGEHFRATLDQGRPEFLGAVDAGQRAEFATALNLDPSDLRDDLPLEVVSTGLRYLIVPVKRGLDRARIVDQRFPALLESVGAEFVYVLDVEMREGRHWNNDGLLEDVATGSAAGTVGAYLVEHAWTRPDEEFVLHQGRFVRRPSQIRVCPMDRPADVQAVLVGGDVAMVGRGQLDVAPRER